MKERTQKSNTFFGGAAILAVSIAIVKIIGALYKIPLGRILGDVGFGHFNNAYAIYNLLLMISTAGLPVAMSKTISEANALDRRNQVNRVFRVALVTFVILGSISSLVMFVFAQPLANLQGDSLAAPAVRVMALSCFFVCTMSAYRGYAQGHSDMVPTAVSQVLEALTKLGVGLVLAWYILYLGFGSEFSAAGAIGGVTASGFVSLVYLMIRHHRRNSGRGLAPTDDKPERAGQILKTLAAIAIPITFGSAALQLMTMLETKIYMGQLLNLGYTQSAADTMRGVYGMCLTIFNMPCAFITPITISIIPAITSHLTLCGDDEAKATEESAVRITGLIAMPCAFGLALLAEPITALLGGYSGGNLAMATRLMTVLGFTIIFNALVLVSTAIMQAHGHAGRPVINMLIGGVVNLVAVYVLAGMPLINILGTPTGLLMGYVVISILNILSMRRLLPKPPAILPNLLRSFFAAAVMGVLAWGALWALKAVGVREIGTGRLILCAVPVLVGVVSYFFTAVKFKVITHEDCLLLPKGEKIAKILKL